MIAYQVNVNGKQVATAGLHHGVVSAIANWISVPSDVAKDPQTDWNAGFSLGGLDNQTSENLRWFRCDVKVGDEITIKLVEAAEVDQPLAREPRKK